MKSEHIVTLLLSFLITYLLYIIMAPFFVPIFWAIVFVILFYPYYKWLLARVTKYKSLASLAACLSIAIFLIVPMAFLSASLINELYTIYQWAENYLTDISTRAHKSPIFIIGFLEKYLGAYIDISKIDLRSIFANSIKDIATFAGEGLRGFIQNFASSVFNMFLAFFSMYFLFKDGDKILNLFKDLMPLSDSDKRKILARNRDVISATMYGGVLVGAVQGFLGGLAFWYLGLPAPLLWGFVMFMFSFLPTVGTAMIWIPASIYLFATGQASNGIILVIWGTFVIGLVDNVMRPYIVSGKTQLHPLLLFFSILGAVNAFGFIGIIAGPLIISVGQTLIEIYHDYIGKRNTWTG